MFKSFRALAKILRGDEGEKEVVESLRRLLKINNESNFFIMQKVQIEDVTTTKEIDVLLLHPVYGIFIIEVKNWKNLNHINEKNPFFQAKRYKNLLMAQIEDVLGKVPINIEFRVFFPHLTYDDARKFFRENPNLSPYKKHAFFKDDLQSKENFKRFFITETQIIPNKKEFLTIASMFIDKEKIKDSKERIIPVISKDDILFFDYKQLTVLNGYTGGFRIIRGVAGTGKTIILANFVNNRLKKHDDENFLILCFNRKLVENMKNIFEKPYLDKNVHINSIFGFLNEIGFDYEKCGLKNVKDLDEKFEKFESDEALNEFKEKLREWLKTHPIDYFLCDETQDMPEGFMRIIYEEINDCIFFIDEAQKFYKYSMDSISEVFHHPKFEKLSMKGRVKNLKNVYRTPANIAKCAFEILSKDTKLNAYYRKSHYLQNEFTSDINFVLEDGNIYIDDFDKEEIIDLCRELKGDTIVLTLKNDDAKNLKEVLPQNVQVMASQGVKGLEADNIIIYKFHEILNVFYKYDREIFYRKIYVLLTRAQKNIYLSIDESKLNEELKPVLEIFKKYQKKNAINNSNDEVKLTKLNKINLDNVKKTGELVVLGAELFSVIAGLFT